MEIPKNIFQYDWAAMSAADQRAFFAKNGFLVIPQLFTPEEVDLMHKEIEQYGLAEKKIDMSEAFCSAPSFCADGRSSKACFSAHEYSRLQLHLL